MNIGILLFGEPSSDRYANVEEIEAALRKQGHEPLRIYESKLTVGYIGDVLSVSHAGNPLLKLDALIVRPNFTEEPGLHVSTLHIFSRLKIPMLNGHPDTFIAKNKIAQHELFSRENIPMPYWVVARSSERALEAAQELKFPVILKVAFGTHGKGVFFADSSETLLPIADYLAVRDKNPFIVEECILEAGRSDIRVFVLDGSVNCF